MKNKLFRNCVYISTFLLLGILGLYIYAEIADPHPNYEVSPTIWPHISFCDANVTVTKIGGGSLIFFKQALPYLGGTIAFTGDKTVIEKGWDSFGIYFRAIEKSGQLNDWTFMINLWYPIILFAILPTVFLAKKIRARKSASTKESTVEK